ncbi:Blue-light-activated protein [Lacunisphaera limnophila]|uniref:histidine kinase n=1 Tax=Lacunisphaera limnophila TaxID=1838286 RepID=A0A1D8AWV1_9BACT|nr:ATP-binding protein [Lacunisphaera limnophila]AOS45369.1 Blue-light-activated protein [Lacunisphaera limnophila]
MQPVIVQMIIMLHAAFGCMFLFMHWQHPTRFARLFAQSWLLEAVRVGIIYSQLNHPGGFSHWHSLSDCLNLVVTWWLLAGAADLAGVRLPPWLGRWILGGGIPVILGLRYVAPAALESFGLAGPRAVFWSVFVELTFIHLLITLARAAMLFWFIRMWRATRLPGTILAIIFIGPYIVFALAVPVQYYLTYYPEWIYGVWAARVLGFSLGLVMLLFDRQLREQRERERAYRRIVETTHDLIWTVDAAGCWSSVNPAARGIYGCAPAQLLGRPFLDWVIPAQRAADAQVFERIKAGQPVFDHETIHRRQDGSLVNLTFDAAVLRDEQGRVIGATGTARDITEQKQAEARVRRLANFPELNPNPVLEFTAEGMLAYQNPAALAMVAKMGLERLDQLWPAETAAIVGECLKSGQPRLRLVTEQGRTTLSWSFYPIVPEGVVHCYIGDITERTQLEGRLRQAQKMEAVGQLAGGVAHDFNNLLTAIIGHLGLLQTGRTLPPDMAESLAEISLAANRAANLTGQLLAFSRLQVVSMRSLDLNEAVSQLAKLLRRLLGEDIAMQLDFAPERLGFRGDASMIDQVVINLAVNARDAMPGGGVLRITTGHETRTARTGNEPARGPAPGEYVRLTVSDSGQGIPPEVLPKIFEPFFTTKEVGKGTGLGLATAFGIIQQHDGWIEVDSEPGRGTTFRVYLPRLADLPAGAQASRPAAARRGQGELILLVEDEPAVREIGVRALTGQGYRVLSAAHSQAALELWREHQADITLLLTDLIMPGGMSGLQLSRLLLAERPDLRVIYSSGYSREIAGKELAMEDGVNYLAKPYELEDLYRIVRDAIDGGRSRPPFPEA